MAPLIFLSYIFLSDGSRPPKRHQGRL